MVYVGFMDLEEAYDKVNRKALWKTLRMYDVSGKLLNGIKSMYVDRLSSVKVKNGERECFSVDSGVRQSCVISPWLFNMYRVTVMKEV